MKKFFYWLPRIYLPLAILSFQFIYRSPISILNNLSLITILGAVTLLMIGLLVFVTPAPTVTIHKWKKFAAIAWICTTVIIAVTSTTFSLLPLAVYTALSILMVIGYMLGIPLLIISVFGLVVTEASHPKT